MAAGSPISNSICCTVKGRLRISYIDKREDEVVSGGKADMLG